MGAAPISFNIKEVQAAPVDFHVSQIDKQPSAEGFWHSLGAQFGITPEAAEAAAKDSKDHPIKTFLENALGPAYQAGKGLYEQGKQTGGELYQAGKSLAAGNPAEATVHAVGAVPIVGPAMVKGANQAPATTGNYIKDVGNVITDPGTMGTVVGASANAAPLVAGGLEKFRGEPAPVKSAAPGTSTPSKLDRTIPGTNTTPRQRFQAAQRVGAQLDAADATASPSLGVVKKVNENSATAAPTYEGNKAANLAAVKDYTQNVIDQFAAPDRETGGAKIQQDLLADQQRLKGAAGQAFQNLHEQVGGAPVEDGRELGMTAARIAAEQEPYFKQFPSLRPSRTMSVIEDVGALKPGDPRVGRQAPQPLPTWETLQRLRSDIHGVYANNPDIVQTRANGWLQQLVSKTDDAITGGSANLTPEQLKTFRAGNEAWGEMKQNYDSASGPYFSAVREVGKGGVDPTTLAKGFGPKTPNFVRDLTSRVSPESMNIIRRGVLEDALGTAPGGGYNYASFPRKWNALPKDYVNELYGPETAQKIQDLADTTHALNRDYNPSGTAKTGQKMAELGGAGAGIGELAAGRPEVVAGQAAYHAAQYGVAKLMNSPKVVGWLLKDIPPAKSGPSAWANAGAAKLMQHGVSAAAIANLSKSQNGMKTLMKASGLTPGTPAMESLTKGIEP